MADRLFDTSEISRPMPRPRIPELHEGVGRIVLVYAEAREEEVRAGMRWYQDAHDTAARLAEEVDLKVEQVAGVIAEISPRLHWDANVQRAADFLRNQQVRGLQRSFDFAAQILAGQDPFKVINDPVRMNYKVQAFFDNIIRPQDSVRATIDRHMLDMIFNERGIAQAGLARVNEGEYRAVEKMFQEAAAAFGILPHELQSICWVTWRRKFGIQAVSTIVQPELNFD